MICEIIEAPVGVEQYERMREALGLANGEAPPGASLHIAGPVEDGGLRIVTLWDSREAAAHWRDRVRRVRERIAIQPSKPGAGSVTLFDVHNLSSTRAA